MRDDSDMDNLQDRIDPEIESRLAALVLGDLSAPQAEELERLILEHPGLRTCKERLASIHERLPEALVPQDEEEWKLSQERRARLLKTFAAPAPAGGSSPVNPARERRIRASGRRVMWSVAACFGLTLFLVTFLTQPWMALETGSRGEEHDRVTGGDRSVSRSSAEVEESGRVVEPSSARRGVDRADPKTNRLRIPLDSQKTEQPMKESAGEHGILEAEPRVAGAARVEPDAPPQKSGTSLPEARAIAESVPAPPAPPTPRTLSKRPRALPGDARPPVQARELLKHPAEVPAHDSDPDEVFQGPAEEEPDGREREVAFLGLGALLGLSLGLAFGLGLGRTWHRRAQSSH